MHAHDENAVAEPEAVIKIDPKTELLKALDIQRNAFSKHTYPTYEERIKDLKALKNAILKHQDAFCAAVSEDYGHRSVDDTLRADVLPTIHSINYCMKNLKKWMKPSRRSAGLLFLPSTVRVHYQPVGIVGIIVPWNVPMVLSLAPLAYALASGNSAMIKLSELVPKTNKVLRQICNEVFTEQKVAIFEGEADVAAAFSSLPFDHLLFTGSTAVGKHVMRAASENLTPVTLELGGKSPTIIAPDMDIDLAVNRLIFGKSLNAGQLCISTDYILCPKDKVDELLTSYKKRFASMYSNQSSDDYSSVVNDGHFVRLKNLLNDAVNKGAKVHSATNENVPENGRRMATQLVTDVSDDMEIMQSEIFGPLLPIVGYSDLDEAIEYVKSHDRPLSLYIMSHDSELQERVLKETHSGGVSINETVFQFAVDDAPFGGTGPSGIGNYHGKEGFIRFSHAKTVLKSGRINTAPLLRPPYGGLLQKLLLKIFIR
ncbi:coniferyl-aldehyde dehydrogenase [Veronia pacifica]|uniref:Aldehyde dehydrogenase n=2 Tax=Veronia pacifica TaxID=1080227 RepID=A0A1C3EL12_9GAMM|nr:coniferyl-aldehyde dehydrogenase [Veronia pacifica]